MAKSKTSKIIFSSSAAVYANPKQKQPMNEHHPKGPMNPYGRTKWMVEQILDDFKKAHGLQYAALRYFNAAGADQDGEIGEQHEPETHLIPRLFQSLEEGSSPFTIYNDGIAIRDFVHVTDLAKAHVKALQWLVSQDQSDVFNIGSGKGYSVLNVIETLEQITGKVVPKVNEVRDIPESLYLVADPKKAEKTFGWKAECSDLKNILKTARSWHESRLTTNV